MNWKLYLQTASLEIRRITAYRLDFWANFVASMFAHVTIAYFLWKAIFEATGSSEIAGYSFYELLFYYFLVSLVLLAQRSGTFAEFAEEIFQGAFTRYVLYPMPVLRYRLAMYMGRIAVYTIPLVLGVIGFISFLPLPESSTTGILPFLSGLAALLFGSVLFFHLRTCSELLAFWVDQVWTLLVIEYFLTSLLGGSMIPLSFFPDWAKELLAYLPFGCLVSFPVRSFMGTISLSEWIFSLGICVFWTLFFLLLAEWMLSKGKYRYTGVGI